LLATVKGDVHDIGKNIVGVVLACNGYNIIDLGVMTPLEKIIDTIKNNKIDIVGLSGLITPSLEEMTFIADEFLKQGIDLPIMIGGATTSRAHTAYKIAANNKQVVYVADASKAAVVASQLMNNRQEFFEQLNQEYAVISDRIHNKQISLLDYHTANAFQYEIDSKICLPTFLGAKEIHLDMETLTTFIDWQPFFSLWNLKGKWPEILHNQVAHDLFQDTIYLLDKMIHQYNIQIKAKIGFYKAIKQGNDIYLPEVGTTFYHLRNQGENAQNLCLADFINNEDYIGIFALCVDVEDLVKQFDIDNDEYKSILTKAIADRIAEGGAEYLHLQVRKELWAYAPNENLTHKEIFQEKYQGIRPAAGYPTSPDHSEKTTLFKLLDFPAIELTETFSMLPASAVCGFYFNNQASKYFNVGKISEEQLQDYANRKKIDLDLARKKLAHNLI
jgi:5-methyltetrahydrofolate--homocysteine methyltransferase